MGYILKLCCFRSFGVVLWEIFSLGYMPYPGRDNHEVIQLVTAGTRLEPPSSCPCSIISIMSQCWEHNPDSRPHFVAIINKLEECIQVIFKAEHNIRPIRICDIQNKCYLS